MCGRIYGTFLSTLNTSERNLADFPHFQIGGIFLNMLYTIAQLDNECFYARTGAFLLCLCKRALLQQHILNSAKHWLNAHIVPESCKTVKRFVNFENLLVFFLIKFVFGCFLLQNYLTLF